MVENYPKLVHYKLFHAYFSGDLPYSVSFIFPNQELPTDDDSDYKIHLVEPDITKCHIAMGRFVNAWSLLELSTQSLLAKMLGVKKNKVSILVNALGSRSTLDIIKEFGVSVLKKNESDKLLALTERMKKINTKRNRIIHGCWEMHVLVRKYGERFTHKIYPARCYTPSDEETKKSLSDTSNPKRKNYIFTVDEINQITGHLDTLSQDMQNFTLDVFGSI